MTRIQVLEQSQAFLHSPPPWRWSCCLSPQKILLVGWSSPCSPAWLPHTPGGLPQPCPSQCSPVYAPSAVGLPVIAEGYLLKFYCNILRNVLLFGWSGSLPPPSSLVKCFMIKENHVVNIITQYDSKFKIPDLHLFSYTQSWNFCLPVSKLLII